MIWKDFSKSFKDGDHAFLSPSTYNWLNYNDDKLIQVYINKLATVRGTELHALACKLIQLKVLLPSEPVTLNMYVNDAIRLHLHPEMKLWYSKFCYGTADALNFENWVLRVHDLKTGKTKTSFNQLKCYAALFYLCYPEIHLRDVKDTVLCIYQNNERYEEHPDLDEIVHIMDTIQRFSKNLQLLEDEYDEN